MLPRAVLATAPIRICDNGGASFIEMIRYPRARVSQLPLPDPLRYALQRRLAVVFLGRAHSSSAVHEKVVRRLQQRGPDCAELETLRAAALHARDALLAGDLAALGSALRDNTAAGGAPPGSGARRWLACHRDRPGARSRRVERQRRGWRQRLDRDPGQRRSPGKASHAAARSPQTIPRPPRSRL